MIIYVNSKALELEYPINIKELLSRQNIPSAGTAVAVNGKMVRRPEWTQYMLNDGNEVLIISAAYGG